MLRLYVRQATKKVLLKLATIGLSVLGSVVGSRVGGPKGAQWGQAAGAILGALIEGSKTKPQDVGKLSDLKVSGSSYGASIPWVFGTHRTEGTIIFSGGLIENKKKKGVRLLGTRRTEYSYSVDVGVMLCKGPVTAVRRIWANDLLIWDNSTGQTSEVQQISVGTNTGGTFTATFRGYTSAAMAWDETTATVQSTLEALPSIGAGNIVVTGPDGGPWLASFIGDLAGQNVPRMDMSDTGLTGGSGEGITTVQQGATTHQITVKLGDDEQEPIPAMEAAQGGPVPAYRGRCYFYINDLDLTPFGNQVPSFSAEVENIPTISIATDDFNRADGALGETGTGQTWLWDINSIEGAIVDNVAYTDSTPGEANWIECNRSDVTLRGTVVAAPIIGTASLVFRLTDSDNGLWFGDDMGFGPGAYTLQKQEGAGAFTTLATAVSTAGAPGDVLKVVCQGSQIDCYVNDVLVISTTSTFNQSATKHGFGSNTLAGLDDFSVTVEPDQCLLSTILDEIAAGVGIEAAERDFSASSEEVNGCLFDQRVEARGAIDDLLTCYFTDLAELDGQIVSVPRGGAVAMTLDADDLGAVMSEGGEVEFDEPVSVTRIQELELPFRVDLVYISATNGYQTATQSAIRFTKTHLQEQLTVNTRLVFTDAEAKNIAERLLYDTWLGRQSFETSLPPRYLPLAPADVVILPFGDQSFRCRLISQDLALPGPIRCLFRLDEESVLVQGIPAGVVPPETASRTLSGESDRVAWNGNAMEEADIGAVGLYWTANSAEENALWAGASLFLSRDGGTSYQEVDESADRGTFGTAATALAAFTETRLWDDVNPVDVTITNGADTPPETRSDAEVLAGENRAWIGDELIAFGTVTALGGDTYRLAHLLRGLRGTDAFWDEHVIGERVVMDDGGIRRVEVPGLAQGQVLVKIAGSGQTVADVGAQEVSIHGRELLAWAPVQFSASRNGGNDITLTWERRSRLAGAGIAGEPPLDFQQERYSVLVLPSSGTSITAITRAEQAVVTAAGHGLAAGDLAYLTGISGMLPANNLTIEVLSVSGNDVTLDLDSRWMPAYGSGGSIRKPIREINATTETAQYLAATQSGDGLTPGNPVMFALSQLNDAGFRGYQNTRTL